MSNAATAGAQPDTEAVDETPFVNVLDANSPPIVIAGSTDTFVVRQKFSHLNTDIALHEPPPLFLGIFGGFRVEPCATAKIVRRCVVTHAVSVKRLRAKFGDFPCHLDCRLLYGLLRSHFLNGQLPGGLSVGAPALPHSNAFTLIAESNDEEGRGEEHFFSLRLEQGRWRIHIEQPKAKTPRFSQDDTFLVPDSSMNFRQ